MAYCVHCGVKLGESEQRCPLCDTVVLDPRVPRDPSLPLAYPPHTPEQEIRRSKRFLLSLAAVFLLFPSLLCLLIDYIPGTGLSWSIYPCGALILLFITAAIFILLPRHRIYISLGMDFLALSGYLWMVEQVSDSGTWFLPIVFPALGAATVMLASLVISYRAKRLNKLTALAAVIVCIGLECILTELFCLLHFGGPFRFLWSPYVAAPCLFLCLALYVINSNQALREELRRRVHF
ncbi:MAG: hypothetical protein E7324_06830 [Clostridiales bacterium]|nr:hypothetical protein [Clostridiales bacterium]